MIVPAYNYGHFIAETLNSVKAQSYPDWECIVIDNGSTDQTAEVIRPFLEDGRFKYFYQEQLGVSAARNRGIALAKGDFIQFLDADDLVEQDKFAKSIRLFEADPSLDVVYSDVRYFTSTDPGKLFYTYQCESGDQAWMKYVSGAGKPIIQVLVMGNNFVISSPMVRKSALKRSGVFDLNLDHNEDWDFWLRLALSGSGFRYLSEEHAKTLIRVHHRSASRNLLRMQACGLIVLMKNALDLKTAGFDKLRKQREREHRKSLFRSLSKAGSASLLSDELRLLKSMGLFPELSAEASRPLWLSRLFMKIKAMLS